MNHVRYIDDVIIDYARENNRLILQDFGDICYILHKKTSGSVVAPYAITSYDNAAHTIFTIWAGTPGGTPNLNHPDTRYDANDGSGFITVTRDGDELTRIPELDTLDATDEYKVYSNLNNDIQVEMYASGSVVTVGYTTLCYCVDPERSQGRTDCTTCYGTMYEGGYDIDAGVASDWNPSGTLLVRIPPADEDKFVETVRNLRQDETNEAWTLAPPEYPILYDYDRIYPITGAHSGSYFEISKVKLSHLRTYDLSQRFSIHNDADTDIIYQFPLAAVTGSIAYYLDDAVPNNL